MQFVAAVLLVCAIVAAERVWAAASTFEIADATMGSGADLLRMKVLSNTATGENVTVITDAGGRVEQLYLGSRSGAWAGVRDVLLGHDGDASAVRANKWWKGCLLAPFANRIGNGTYVFQGNTYYLPRNEQAPGRSDALHGWLCNRTMTVASAAVTSTAATLTLFYAFDGTDPGYPFQMDLSVTYTLDASHGFTVGIFVYNTMLEAGQALPWTFGWHPYFRMRDVSQTTVVLDLCVGWNHVTLTPGAPQGGTLLPMGKTTPLSGLDGSLPIGGTQQQPTYFDDEFKATKGLTDCDGGVLSQQLVDPTTPGVPQTVVLWQDASFRVAQLFTGSMQLFGESAVTLEPMTALANAYNNADGLVTLSANQQWDGAFGVYML